MYKATRILIESRLKHSRYKVEMENVRHVGGGKPNECFQNTYAFQSVDVLGSGCTRSMPVSGWLVSRFDKSSNSTEVIQHWWNMDTVTRQQFDTTPFANASKNAGYEYVSDIELSLMGNERFREIRSNVATSLLLKDGAWFTAELENELMRYRPIEELKAESILRLI